MSKRPYNQHPIQLTSLQVLKLSIEVHDVKSALSDNYNPGHYTMESGNSRLDPETNTIHVSMRVRAGRFACDDDMPDDEQELNKKQPVSILVEVGAIFKVDTSKFSIENIDSWASRNAPLTIYPYVREQVYGLSSRVGIKPLLLPLLEVPTFKVSKK